MRDCVRDSRFTHSVEDPTNHPREGASSSGLRVEQAKISRRGEDEGDRLERVLVRALGTVELLWEVLARWIHGSGGKAAGKCR